MRIRLGMKATQIYERLNFARTAAKMAPVLSTNVVQTRRSQIQAQQNNNIEGLSFLSIPEAPRHPLRCRQGIYLKYFLLPDAGGGFLLKGKECESDTSVNSCFILCRERFHGTARAQQEGAKA